jgi:hypothetical protein
LYLRPLPQWQGSFRPRLTAIATACQWRERVCGEACEEGLGPLTTSAEQRIDECFAAIWIVSLDRVARSLCLTKRGGDLSRPHQFIRVAEAMVELGRDEEAIGWARRGIEQTTSWQTDQLYDIACAAHGRREEPAKALALRRAQHERTPTSSSYRQLRTVAEANDAWPVERDAARRVLSDRNPPALVDALLDDGEDELGWQTATALPDADPGDHAWLRLAELGRRPTRRRRCLSTGG